MEGISWVICVVGNSPNLLKTNYGDVIDSHDVIIRCNRYILDGYEKHVGSRTDYRVVNCHFNKKNLRKFPEWKKSRNILENEIIVNKDKCLKVPEAKDVIDFRSESRKFDKNLTAGGCAILFAGLYLKAEKINCYGFTRNHTGNCTHYFEEVSNKMVTHDHEGALTRLSKLYGVVFHD